MSESMTTSTHRTNRKEAWSSNRHDINDDGFKEEVIVLLDQEEENHHDTITSHDENTTNDEDQAATAPLLLNHPNTSSPRIPNYTPIYKQLYWCMQKNVLLIRRRPVLRFIMIFSTVLLMASIIIIESTIPTYSKGHLSKRYPSTEDFDECGVLNDTRNYSYLTEAKYGDGKIPVLLISSKILAICVFMLVNFEVDKKLIGVVRSLGVQDAVYWMSWYIPLSFIALINSFLGTIAAKLFQGYVVYIKHTYFMGIFGSFFFLQIALISVSLFLASLCGSNGLLYVILIVAILIGFLGLLRIIAEDSIRNKVNMDRLSWIYRNTSSNDSGVGYMHYSAPSHHLPEPIMKDLSPKERKREEAQSNKQEGDLPLDEYFLGCYVTAGFTSELWNDNPFILSLFYFIPSSHFMGIYSNFIGYVNSKGDTFGWKHAKMSPEDLAIEALPYPPNEKNAKGTSLFPQGSTVHVDYNYYNHRKCERINLKNNGIIVQPNTQNYHHNLQCQYAANSSPYLDSPSVNKMFGHLGLLSVIYLMLAIVWLKMYPNGNGRKQRVFGRKEKSNGINGSSESHNRADEHCNVVIQNVSKSFGSFEAVKDFTLELKKGQITALLGRNGAGKTTLTNILTCESDLSHGDVKLFGRPIVNSDTIDVYNMIGRCRQDDYLWPNLSVREHLDIFAGLKGVAPHQHDETVQKWLEHVDLCAHQHFMCSEISGGMRRRLSVALATIGDPSFLILDEPTTGMDPESRRFVWKHLSEIKKDKVVLLTTHDMEEADLLADEVAIMKKGKLEVLGSPMELKSTYGSAIQFDLLVEKGKLDDTEMFIKQFFEDKDLEFIQLTKSEAGNLTLTVEKISSTAIVPRTVQEDLEEAAEKASGVDASTLVCFLEWLESGDNIHIHKYNFSNSSLEEVFLNVTKDDHADSIPNHTRRHEEDITSGTEESNLLDGSAIEDPDQDPEMQPTPVNNVSLCKSAIMRLSIVKQIQAFMYLLYNRKWKHWKRSVFDNIFVGAFVIWILWIGFEHDCGTFHIDTAHSVPIFGLSFILIIAILPLLKDKTTGLYHFMRTQGLRLNSYMVVSALYAFLLQLVYGVVLMTAFYTTPIFLRGKSIPLLGNFCMHHEVGLKYMVDESGISHSVRGFTSTGGGYFQMLTIAFIFACFMPGVTFMSLTIPGSLNQAMVVVGFALVILNIALQIFIESFKGECSRFHELSELCSNDGPFADAKSALSCVGNKWMYTHEMEYFMCSSSYLSLLPQFGAKNLIELTILSHIRFTTDSMEVLESDFDHDIGQYCKGDLCKIPFILELYKEHFKYFCYGAVLWNIIGVASFIFVNYTPGVVLEKKDSLKKYLHRKGWIRSSPVATREHDEPNEVVSEKCEEVIEEQKCVDECVESWDSMDTSNVPSILMHSLRKVYPASGRSSPKKVALEGLDLHVRKGEVCGLLGKNGCGKTTAFRILCGDHEASSGLALVGGYDVGKDKMKVIESVGNLAQFDLLWPTLSVKEHLEFFALLKGIPWDLARVKAKSMARIVGLGEEDVYNRHAVNLSGGMRRRLSLSIALIGAPNCLLLDEPSTGLDPSTRNRLWNVITSFASDERAIVISTHMMAEADALCDRIAIMGQGKLRVVGENQYLKDKYGSGYVLRLNLISTTAACHNKAMTFVREHLHHDARLDHVQARMLHIHLPKEIKLSQVFLTMYSEDCMALGCIIQFSLSQSSLEDVFLALGSD